MPRGKRSAPVASRRNVNQVALSADGNGLSRTDMIRNNFSLRKELVPVEQRSLGRTPFMAARVKLILSNPGQMAHSSYQKSVQS